ncbi:MAG: hypothetical protein HZC14_00540 [Candidatus Niyogibacteria bacterium]|nr:hypothetical protein [Candidatus Niyogibacteria bacterium]
MREKTKIKVAKTILEIVRAAGFISMALVAPNALQALEILYAKDKKKYSKSSYVKRSIYRLQNAGLIEFQERNDKKMVCLTEKGRQKLLKYELGEIVIDKPKQWDGKWRIIIFDIKETKRGVRDIFRERLVCFGFVKLQNSVWVYPYECEEVIILLKSYLKTGKEILYITATSIENDRWIRSKFNL